MKTTRRKFTKEFKQQAVARMQSNECSVEQLARELELEPSLLYKWRRSLQDHKDHAFPGKGHLHEDDELTRLRKEVASLKKERDFLKKAALTLPRSERRGQIRVHPSSSTYLLGSHDVSRASGVCFRLLPGDEA